MLANYNKLAKWIFWSQLGQLLAATPGAVKKVFLRGYDGHILSGTTTNRVFLFFLNRATFCSFEQLVDLIVYDRPGKKLRFQVIYNLLSTTYNNRLQVLVQVDELTHLDSVMDLYPSAGWLEREVWDMFGIFVAQHQDLRRILTDYGFAGFPLRKDFPLTGFVETYYSDEQKRIVYQPVELSQEMRQFTYDNTWEIK